MSALALWLNILLCTAAFGIVVGVPMWMVLRHPDRDPAETRRLPAYLRPEPKTETATPPAPAWAPSAGAASPRRELAGQATR
ncbi:MAG: hypothetical protein ACRDNW_05800 [Trebonia sp.]